mgnify:CR=1 FL=1
MNDQVALDPQARLDRLQSQASRHETPCGTGRMVWHVWDRSGGKDPATVAQLVRLAEAISLPVFDVAPTHMNFPHNHRLHQGGDAMPYLDKADVVVVLEDILPMEVLVVLQQH